MEGTRLVIPFFSVTDLWLPIKNLQTTHFRQLFRKIGVCTPCNFYHYWPNRSTDWLLFLYSKICLTIKGFLDTNALPGALGKKIHPPCCPHQIVSVISYMLETLYMLCPVFLVELFKVVLWSDKKTPEIIVN